MLDRNSPATSTRPEGRVTLQNGTRKSHEVTRKFWCVNGLFSKISSATPCNRLKLFVTFCDDFVSGDRGENPQGLVMVRTARTERLSSEALA